MYKYIYMIGIYKITSPSGKIYIGQSTDLLERFKKYSNPRWIYKQIRLHNSLLKHGHENHIYEIIEECVVDDLNKRERYWQDYYNVLSENGLNCKLTETNEKRRIYTNESLEKFRVSNTGERNPMFGKKGILNNRSKKVINLITNEIYNSLTECCIENNLNPKYMSRWLNGKRKNNTNFIYLKDAK